MRSSVYFNDIARARARTERARQQTNESADDHRPKDNPEQSNESSTSHRAQHEKNEKEEYYAKIRNNLNRSPIQPGKASFRAMQSVLPERPIDSFQPDTWWIVDRQYRPRLRGGATPLVSRCMRAYGWSEAYSRRVLHGYRQFLQLKTATNDWDALVLEPSKDINRLWQQHILDVVNYVFDCLLLCGHVLGHLPDEEELIEERIQRRRDTKQLLENVFSEIDGEIWREVILTQTIGDEGNEEEQPFPGATEMGTAHEKIVESKRILRTVGHEEKTEATKIKTKKRILMTRKERRARSPRQERPLLGTLEYKVPPETPKPTYLSPRARFESPPHSRPLGSTQTSGDDRFPTSLQSFGAVTKKTGSLTSSTQFSGFNRTKESYQSPGRPRTPMTERIFTPIQTSCFRAMGGDGRECRLDSPTPRASSTGRLEYEIETDWGVRSFELDEDGLMTQMDPIDARRQGYHQDAPPTFQRSDLFDSHLMVPSIRRETTRVKRSYIDIPDDRKPVTIHIRDQVGVVTSSRARRSTKLGRVFATYAAGKGIKPAQLTFFLNGKLIDSSDTPASLNLRDHDKINCVTGKARN